MTPRGLDQDSGECHDEKHHGYEDRLAARPNSGVSLEPAELTGATLDEADAVIGFRRAEFEVGLAGNTKPLAGLERVLDWNARWPGAAPAG